MEHSQKKSSSSTVINSQFVTPNIIDLIISKSVCTKYNRLKYDGTRYSIIDVEEHSNSSHQLVEICSHIHYNSGFKPFDDLERWFREKLFSIRTEIIFAILDNSLVGLSIFNVFQVDGKKILYVAYATVVSSKQYRGISKNLQSHVLKYSKPDYVIAKTKNPLMFYSSMTVGNKIGKFYPDLITKIPSEIKNIASKALNKIFKGKKKITDGLIVKGDISKVNHEHSVKQWVPAKKNNSIPVNSHFSKLEATDTQLVVIGLDTIGKFKILLNSLNLIH